MTALLLLGPWTPMLFQGQEFGASSPFVYFTDMSGDLREAIRKGRFKFLAQFPSIASDEGPAAVARSLRSGDFRTLQTRFFRARKEQAILRSASRSDQTAPRRFALSRTKDARSGWRGAWTRAVSFCAILTTDDDDRLLVVNLGDRLPLEPAPEPLLAPPFGFQWETLWTSDSPRYGGPGAEQVTSDEHWVLPAEAAVALHPVPRNRSAQATEAER